MWQWEERVGSLQKYTMLVENSLEIAASSPAHLPPDTSPGTSPRALPRCKWTTNAAELHISTYGDTPPGCLMQHRQVLIMERVQGLKSG